MSPWDDALHVALRHQPHWLSLHIAGPSQFPLVDKPHPASVTGTLPAAVSWCSREEIVQAVQNDSGVAYWNYRQFPHDTFNWDDLENWFLVVKLVQDQGTDRVQPTWNVLIVIICIVHTTTIIDLIDIITILRIVVCSTAFQHQQECAFEGLWSSVSRSRCWKQEQNQSKTVSGATKKGSIIDTLPPNHNNIQAMTAMKGFCLKWSLPWQLGQTMLSNSTWMVHLAVPASGTSIWNTFYVYTSLTCLAQCKAVRPNHLVRSTLRLTESGTDLSTILRCFL